MVLNYTSNVQHSRNDILDYMFGRSDVKLPPFRSLEFANFNFGRGFGGDLLTALRKFLPTFQEMNDNNVHSNPATFRKWRKKVRK